MKRIDIDEIAEKAAAAATLTEHAWRVYRCRSAGPEEACGIKDAPFISTDIDAGQRGVVFDTSRGECHHHMHVLLAEHIAANSPQVTLALVERIRELEAAASGDDCRAPGAHPCECCGARGGYQ